MDKLRAVYKFLCKAEMLICGVGFIALIALIFASAILRFYRISLAWNIDMAMLLLAWTAFLGADLAYRQGQLVGIDIVTRNLPRQIQKLVAILVSLIMLAALIVIAIFGTRLAIIEWGRTYQSIPIPFSIVTLSMTVAGASMVVSTIIQLRRSILTFNSKEALEGNTDGGGL